MIFLAKTTGVTNRRSTPQPLEIYLRAIRGAFDYGNQFGRPVTLGFSATFSQVIDGTGTSTASQCSTLADQARSSMSRPKKIRQKWATSLFKLAAPAIQLGLVVEAASSSSSGQNTEELDYNSVQRGNGEMGNRAARPITACAELGELNPIANAHDQGAGGPSNVLTELVEPLGGRIKIRNIVLGDKTMSVLAIWCGEYQERYGFLVYPERIQILKSICERERVNCEILGVVTGDGKIIVEDSDGSRLRSTSTSNTFSPAFRNARSISKRFRKNGSLSISVISRLPMRWSVCLNKSRLDQRVTSSTPWIGVSPVLLLNNRPAGLHKLQYLTTAFACKVISHKVAKLLSLGVQPEQCSWMLKPACG
jgi:phosphoribosylformylglycinamidine (FGAM) synthase-like enzyme